jgi:hypothetical protein
MMEHRTRTADICIYSSLTGLMPGLSRAPRRHDRTRRPARRLQAELGSSQYGHMRDRAIPEESVTCAKRAFTQISARCCGSTPLTIVVRSANGPAHASIGIRKNGGFNGFKNLTEKMSAKKLTATRDRFARVRFRAHSCFVQDRNGGVSPRLVGVDRRVEAPAGCARKSRSRTVRVLKSNPQSHSSEESGLNKPQ